MAVSPSLSFIERGSGPPLLLIHGLMVAGEMFEPVLDSLAARHRVIVPDLRGHGASRGLPPPYTVPQHAADLAALLNHLRIASAAILGYSQGGAVAQQLVLSYPTLCTRLVLACTYAFNRATARERIEGWLVPALLTGLGMRRFARLVIGMGLRRVDARRAAWVQDMMARQDLPLMRTAWKEAMTFDSRPRLREIACPTLIVAGELDTAVPMHHARMLRDGIAGSTLQVIAGGDHAVIWAQPQEFVRVVSEFLGAE